MPIYTYENKLENCHCTYCLGGFDVMQKITDPELTHCTYCGAPIKKIITSVKLNGKTTASPSSTLSAKNIAKNDFTQYRKVGRGKYEKTAGKGPDTFSADD